MHVLEHNRKERKSTGALLKEMVKRKLFTAQQVLKGFEWHLLAAEELIVDLPKLLEYLAQIVEPIFEEGVVNIGFLKHFAALSSPSMAPIFVAASLKELTNASVIFIPSVIFYYYFTILTFYCCFTGWSS